VRTKVPREIISRVVRDPVLVQFTYKSSFAEIVNFIESALHLSDCRARNHLLFALISFAKL
jgi:hypothetical protein